MGIIPEMFLVRASKFHLDELIALLSPLTSRLFVIASDYGNTTPGVEIVPIKGTRRASFLSKALEQVFVHLQMLRVVATLSNEIDVLIFFLGGIEFAIPLAFAKCLNIKCFAILTNVPDAKRMQAVQASEAPQPFGELTRLSILALLERLTCYFADKLIVYDESLVDQCGLRKFRKKITIAHRHFIDFDTYRFEDDVEQRDNLVTYIGRLHEEKGVLNLVKAIPKILEKRGDVKFVLVGDGHLEDEIRRFVDTHALHRSVTLTGWVPHRELPKYLTASKLQVLPSYNEGLPHVMLEAMACGTPVLATPVGAVPQVIKDKETGFLIHDNAPSSLAERIVEVLAYPHLRRIASNARTLVQSEFQYESVLKTWRNVICDEGGT
jgi:glycosyltransferase involved in cell wall biosynthesis